MYWWNIKALKATLSSAGLSERTNVYYLLVCTVAATGGMEFMAYVPYESINLWRLVITTGYLLLAIGGTYAFYKANGGERGVRILERYLSLGLVVVIRLLPLMIVMFVCLGVYVGVSEGIDDDFMTVTGPTEAFVTLFWAFLVWLKMVLHVRDVAKATRDDDAVSHLARSHAPEAPSAVNHTD